MQVQFWKALRLKRWDGKSSRRSSPWPAAARPKASCMALARKSLRRGASAQRFEDFNKKKIFLENSDFSCHFLTSFCDYLNRQSVARKLVSPRVRLGRASLD